MPIFARARLNYPVFIGLGQQTPSCDFVFQHQGLHIARDDDIAAATQNKFFARDPRGVSQQRLHISRATHAQQGIGLSGNTEAIEALQRGIALYNGQIHK